MALALMLSAVAIATSPAQATSPMTYSLVFRIDDIPFDGAQEKAALDEAQRAYLDPIIADFLKAGGIVSVDGRCYGCRGTARHRNEMSRRFAEAVADYLVINGVSRAVITTSWHDDQNDIAPAGDGSPAGQFVKVNIVFLDPTAP